MKRKFYEVVTVAEMKEAERHTCEVLGISPAALMERAGAKIFNFLNDKKLIARDKRAYILCGPGNNGGDGLVLARYMAKNGYRVKAILFAEPGKMTKEAEEKYHRLREISGESIVFIDEENAGEIIEEMLKAGYIVDALFGTGFSRAVEGLYLEIIAAANASAATVFSVDIPSGVNGDNGLVTGAAVKADYTLVIQYYKPGNLLNDSCDYCGLQIVLSIGIIRPETQRSRHYLAPVHIASIIKPRRKNSHKYDHGKAVVFGGSRPMPGAPFLAALALLKCGAGIAVMAVNRKHRRYITPVRPEIIVEDYRGGNIGNVLTKASAAAFGPGLGRGDKANYRVIKRLLSLSLPLVIDADGLFYFKRYLHLARENVVITPHYGEFAGLFDLSVDDALSSPLETLEKITRLYPVWVVLKGPTTIIAGDGKTFFYRRPNSGMATAGSGDVLTGVIAGFLAQGYSAEDACKLGVVIHSLAGYAARKIHGEHGMVASDIIARIPGEILNLVLRTGKR